MFRARRRALTRNHVHGYFLISPDTFLDTFLNLLTFDIVGFGVAIAHGAAPLLITELAHPQHRAIFTTIYNSTWYFGSVVAAWLTYGTFQVRLVKHRLTSLGTFTIGTAWSWRIPSIVQAAPSIIQLCAIW